MTSYWNSKKSEYLENSGQGPKWWEKGLQRWTWIDHRRNVKHWYRNIKHMQQQQQDNNTKMFTLPFNGKKYLLV